MLTNTEKNFFFSEQLETPFNRQIKLHFKAHFLKNQSRDINTREKQISKLKFESEKGRSDFKFTNY